ncbi:MAG: NADH-quinone oxidoreductase subunit C [Candidatus Sericytochromatia bacterium]|nr:NADH-quinone oxidoreductase subunit C [Candidatus Sericytochromatia bacterium]
MLTWLKNEPAWDFNFLMDVGGIDYLKYPDPQPERFAVAYHLYSLARNHRVRLKVYVGADDPSVPSAMHLWPTADWMEREVWDQFGVTFSGHTNLKRILNHMEFVGHPLRKDYPITKRQELSINDTLMDEMTAKLKAKGMA